MYSTSTFRSQEAPKNPPSGAASSPMNAAAFLGSKIGPSFASCVANGTGCPELDPGGGGAKIYGSLVMEGGGKINGTVDVVYLPQLVQIFNNSPGNNRYAGLPGSWSDRVAY